MSELPAVSEGVASAEAIDTSSPAMGDTADSPSAETEAASSSEEPTTQEAAVDSPLAESVPEQPVLPEFDFETWGGKIGDLPEMYRPAGAKLEGYYNDRLSGVNTEMSGISTELEQMRQLNDALLLGGEDPRVEQYQGEMKAIQQKLEGLEREYGDYRKQIDAWVESDAQQYADTFKSKHADFFENEEMAAQLVALIEQDWDPEQAVRLLTLGGQAMEVAKKAKSDGVPDSYAIRLAESAVRPAPAAAPRPGAKITSGATVSSTPNQEQMSLHEASTLDDKRLIVARRAIKQAQKGR